MHTLWSAFSTNYTHWLHKPGKVDDSPTFPEQTEGKRQKKSDFDKWQYPWNSGSINNNDHHLPIFQTYSASCPTNVPWFGDPFGEDLRRSCPHIVTFNNRGKPQTRHEGVRYALTPLMDNPIKQWGQLRLESSPLLSSIIDSEQWQTIWL